MKVGATLLGVGIVLGVALAGNPAAAKCVPSAMVGSLEKYEQCK